MEVVSLQQSCGDVGGLSHVFKWKSTVFGVSTV